MVQKSTLSRMTVWRRMKQEGLSREEALKTRKRKPGPKPKGSKRARKRSAPTPPLSREAVELGGCSIQHCDLRELKVANESVDLILTDPPYSHEGLAEWEALAEFSARVLRPGGYLVAYSGIGFLPEVLNLVRPHIRYCWTIACILTGDQRSLVRGRWVTNRYRMILTFRKPPLTSRAPNPDVLIGAGPQKGYHPWQQALEEAEQLIEWFSGADDLVCDPMVGSGTSALASIKLGRRFVGCDIDAVAVQTASARISEFLRQP